MYLHVTRLEDGADDLDLDDFRVFRSSTLGSHWFDLALARETQKAGDERWANAYTKFAAAPAFEIGPVSWLKAGLMEDTERYVPGPVAAIAALVSDAGGDELLPVIDETLIEKLLAAAALPNTSCYDDFHVDVLALADWLQQYQGWRLFEISW